MSDYLLKASEVQARTGMSRSTLYQQIRRGLFPKQRQTTVRSVRWLESEVNDWIASRGLATNQSPAAKGVKNV